MSQVQASTNVEQVKPEELARFVAIALEAIVSTINGKLDFGNFNAKPASVTFASANTPQNVSHGLGRAPAGYIVTSLSANMVVFSGGSSSASTISLQASAAGTAGLLFY